MKQYNTTAVFVAACAGMAFFGVTMLSLGPILGQLNQVVTGATSLPSTMSIGIIVGTILFGPIVDRFGYKWLTIIASVLALGGILGLAEFTAIGWLHGSIACLGLGGGILNGLTNALVADIYDDDKRAGRMGVLGAFYCIGALLWTLLNVFIADFHLPLYAVSVVMVGFIIYFCIIDFPQAKTQSGNAMDSVKQSLQLLQYPVLILFAVALFFQSGFEGASGSFSVEFFKNQCLLDAKSATLAMTWFTIGMALGRFPLGKITAMAGEKKTLYIYLTIALAGVILFTLCMGAAMAYMAMTLIGFGVGATYPVVLNYIGGTFRQQSGTAISLAIFIALLGQYTFNAIVGKAFSAEQFLTLPYMLIGALVMIMILVPISLHFSKK
ncbi:MAG: MFS transporter [Bacteroidales bacterium]|nr:MFS transporter [Candidatus Colicola coprequi]